MSKMCIYFYLFLNDVLKIGLRLVNKCVVFDLILYQTEVCGGIFHEEEVYQKCCNIVNIMITHQLLVIGEG